MRLDEFTQGLERTGRQDAKQPAKETAASEVRDPGEHGVLEPGYNQVQAL